MTNMRNKTLTIMALAVVLVSLFSAEARSRGLFFPEDNYDLLSNREVWKGFGLGIQADLRIIYHGDESITLEDVEKHGFNKPVSFTEETLQHFLQTATLKRELVTITMGIGYWEEPSATDVINRVESMFQREHFKHIVFQLAAADTHPIYREWRNGRYAYGIWGKALVHGEQNAPDETIELTLVCGEDGQLAVKESERFGLEPQARFSNETLPKFLDTLSVNKDFILVLMAQETRDWPSTQFQQAVDALEALLAQQQFERIIFRFE